LKRWMSLLTEKMILWKSPPKLTVSEWADKYRKLSPESSAEAGTWRTSRAEYQRGIMDAISDPSIQEVVVIKSAQVGLTELLNNTVGYYMHQDPSTMLLLQPTLEMAQTWSKDRLSPMLRDTPAIRDCVKDARSRDSGSTILHKQFAGGHITMAGANSPASLASRPIRIVLCDEVDRFPESAGAEGDPISLAKKRSTTYHNRKLFICSTPTIKGESRIEAAFMSSDQRYYFMPCPHCAESIKFEWKHVHWPDKEPHKAAYWCQECGSEINDREKTAMVKAGEWSPTSESHIAGFHINELYSPWVTFGEMAVNFVEAKKLPETLKTWINTALGETWEESGESIDEGDLSERCEVYPAEAPEGVLAIVVGADVQDDRLELEYLGVGVDSETWSLGYEVVYGDPSGVELWQQFDDLLMRKFEHELGRMMPVSAVCIDTGGHHTQDVYKFCKTRFARRVFAIKGVGGMGKPLVSRPTRGNSHKVRLFSVGVDTAKDIVYSRLKVIDIGAGFCHFPADYSEDYFKQLTAEKAVTKYVKGRGVRSWVKKSGGRRNEALDCRVYALAAFELLNANMQALESRLRTLGSAQDEENPVMKAEQEIDVVKEMAKPRSRRRRKAKSSMGFKAGGWG